ncbi:MAG: MFS transporter [Candidatus Nanopelagicales bacterium]
MALGNVRQVLAGRDFRRLFAVRLVSQFSDGLLQASLATFVLFSPERQATAPKVAVAFAILLLPYSVVGPFAGVFLDRWRRRQVLVRANVLRAGVGVVIALIVAAGHDGPDLALTVLVSLGIGRFVLAGLSASLPHVVDGPRLVTANALTPTSGTIASAVGALIGVGIRGIAGGGDSGATVVLVASVVTYLLAAAIAALLGKDVLGPDGTVPGDTVKDVAIGLVDGVRELARRRRAARAIGVVTAHRFVFGALTVGGLLLIRNTLNPSSDPEAALREFAVVTGAAAAGALVGAVVTPAMSRRVGTVPWTSVAILQAGVIVPLGMLPTAYAGLLVAALSVGFAGQSAKVCADTVTQREVHDDHRGRVFALFDMIVNVALVSGITAMAFGAPASGEAPVAYVLLGVVLLATGVWYLRHRAAADSSAPEDTSRSRDH